MASSALSDLIKVYRFPPGRRAYALRRTRALLPQGDPLVAKIDAALAIDGAVLDKQTRWMTVRNETVTWPKEVIELDRDHDRLWGALSGACSSLSAGLGADSEQGAAAGRLETAVFSSGVPALIHLPFVEQRETTDAWLARLRGELAADVEKAGVGAIVLRLTDVNTRFGALLDKRNEASNLSYADVREADSEGQIKFFQIIAMLMGREAENDAERARLLGPILAQNEEIGELYRRRRTVPDVDPATGEVTEPPGVT